MKVYELAKDLNLKSVDLLDKLRKDYNMSVKNHMQSLSAEDVEKIRGFFDKKSKLVNVAKKKSTVTRKRKTTVQSKPSETLSVSSESLEKPVLRTGVIRRRVQKKTAADNVAVEPTLKKTEVKSEQKSEGAAPPPSSGQQGVVSHHIRPGLISSENQDIFKKISLDIEESEVEKKKLKKTTLDRDNQSQQFRATDFRKREVIFQPKKKRTVSSAVSSKKTQITIPKVHKRVIKVYDNTISIDNIAHQIGVKKKDLIKKIKSENLLSESDKYSTFDFDTASIIASCFNYEAKNMTQDKKSAIESLFFGNLSSEKKSKPPVVTVMGHVDHGKTTLLDYIRKSHMVSQEAGGITQHIGAYSVPVGDSFVTFIDTPGHSAFTSMRARGAQVTDIVIIVVAADDGVQPQTIEAINHAKNAKVPIIVAINKVDLPNSHVDQTKKQIMEQELVPEEWGGDTIFCSISALKGTGVKELLEHIHLLAEVNELKANPDRSAMGIIIESRLEKGRGWVMTLLVQEGTLTSGQILLADNQVGRARQMTNDVGRSVTSVGPGMPVEISGFSDPVRVGEPFYVVKNEKEARRLVVEGKVEKKEHKEDDLSIEDLLLKTHTSKKKILNIVLKSDVLGSIEAIKYSIEKLNTEAVNAKIIHANLGIVNESDILLAEASGAVILCFNVTVDPKVRKLVQEKSIDIKSYKIIYDLLKDVESMMASLLDPDIQESFGGTAEVHQVFSLSKVGVIAGCKVVKGKIANHHLVRLKRQEEIIYEGKIGSLKRFKQSVKEVSEGQECGIGLTQYKDLQVGDTIESFVRTEIKKETL